MFGVSFSAKYCRELSIDPQNCLEAALNDLGVKSLRLMSYWDEHEKSQGVYDFTELDWQMQLAEIHGAQVSLCLGLRQPRWPESHWPEWTRNLDESIWQPALLAFIEAIVLRYKDHPSIISWQLENEAMLKRFGERGNFDRKRLKSEFKLVKRLDKLHPVIMSTSDSWGVPFGGPRPDMYGFSVYRYFYDRGAYRHATRPPLFYAVRAVWIRIFKWRQVFIHELQMEPWGPGATADLPIDEQITAMSLDRIKEAVLFARSTGLLPADTWGLEWWYYLKTKHDIHDIWDYMKSVYSP